ncbi:HBR051Cp [Eremothecium sinecaudum]|uniref:HBR051Cp n=1 Tax=Eremothecium sinecaudum TaxID=45286 RepID=A0A109UXH9_9SACH|nr:HBR051Cp [Eremothecium sinecaudum]AMD18952.1 HBR051Cp [Eremothecium sinecaudum]
MNNPLKDISNKELSNRSSNVFKRLNTSPMRRPNYAGIDKASSRFSPGYLNNYTSPKALLAPEPVDGSQSYLRVDTTPSSQLNQVTKISDVMFPKSPIKIGNDGFSNTTIVGGDGSQSRIKNRLSPMKEHKSIISTNDSTLSPTRQNLLTKLQKDEDLSKMTRKNTKINSELVTNFKVSKPNVVTRSRSVKFELPEDRMISMELQTLKEQIRVLLERQDELELRIMELEKDKKG